MPTIMHQITNREVCAEYTRLVDSGHGVVISGDRDGECVIHFADTRVLVTRTLAWADGDILTLADRVCELPV